MRHLIILMRGHDLTKKKTMTKTKTRIMTKTNKFREHLHGLTNKKTMTMN